MLNPRRKMGAFGRDPFSKAKRRAFIVPEQRDDDRGLIPGTLAEQAMPGQTPRPGFNMPTTGQAVAALLDAANQYLPGDVNVGVNGEGGFEVGYDPDPVPTIPQNTATIDDAEIPTNDSPLNEYGQAASSGLPVGKILLGAAVAYVAYQAYQRSR